MPKLYHGGLSASTLGKAALAAVMVAAVAACGGGDSTPPTSTVSSSSVAATRYGSPAIISIAGTNLDSSGLSVTSPGCKNMTRLTSGALVSTATNAYYTCTVSGATKRASPWTTLRLPVASNHWPRPSREACTTLSMRARTAA